MRKHDFIRYYIVFLAIFAAAAALFHFAAGEQLYYKEAKKQIEQIKPNGVIGELVSGLTVEQDFLPEFARLTQIGIMLSDYGKTISGNIRIRLYDTVTEQLLAEKTVEPDAIGTNEYWYLTIKKENARLHGNMLRLEVTSDTGIPGSAATLLYNDGKTLRGGTLYLNGKILPGTLCIIAHGQDEVWTGNHYLELVVALWLFSTGFYVISARRFSMGKRDLLFTTIAAFQKYAFLISQLVERDFKVRYKRSFLGVLWSLLNPLLTMTVQYIVFSQLFRSDIDNFPIYMLTGLVIFSFFTEAVGLSLGAIVWNASLITKVYVPKYMYPITKVLSSTINLVLSLIPIFIGMILTGEAFTKALLLLPYLLICVIGFTMGISMLLSALMVFFRDIQFLWGIVSMLWMYLTALFYPAGIIPENLQWVLQWNPMYGYVTFARTIFMQGMAPEPRAVAVCTLYAVGSLAAGGIVFKKLQDQFVLNL